MDPADDALIPAEPTPPGQRRRVWCRLCHRELNSPESRTAGLGPDCAHKLNQRTAPRRDGHDVEQDALPGI